MRVAVLLLFAVACAPARKDAAVPKIAAGDVLVAATTDAGKMTTLLRGGVIDGGVWFEDASCANQFTVGEIAAELRGEFARCLVGLALKPSTRMDLLSDVAVMTYGPGFEVEARIVDEADGPRLSWIGFASRSKADDVPTIGGAALESLRLAGSPDGPLPAEVTQALDAEPPTRVIEKAGGWEQTRTGFHFTWLKICLDEEGALRSVVPYETTSAAHQDAFVAAASTWRFKPFLFANQPIAVCAMARLTRGLAPPEALPLPLPERTAIVLTPSIGPLLLEGRRVAGEKSLAPTDLLKMKFKPGSRIEFSFRLCVNEAGAVDQVTLLRSTSLAEYDQQVLARVRAWKFSPLQVNGAPVAVCTRQSFVYTSVPVRVIRH